MRKLFFAINFILLSISVCFSQIEMISYRGYPACYRLYNDSVNVIVSPESGGRVLAYSLNGKNIIYENTSLNGKTLQNFISNWFDPDGGRFDIGPEGITTPIHDTLWLGNYTAHTTDSNTLMIVSMEDQQMGLQLKREFKLDTASSHLVIRQMIINKSTKQSTWYFWGRTLVPINGKMIVPLKAASNYPFKWGKYYSNPWRFVYDNPQDQLIAVFDSLLEYKAAITNKSGKFGVDSDDGWMAYGYNGMLFVKKFLYNPEGTYGEPAGQTIVFYSNGSKFVELEPLSEERQIAPGDSTSFTEEWWLLNYEPASTMIFDILPATKYIQEHAFEDPHDPGPNSMIYKKDYPECFRLRSNVVKTVLEYECLNQQIGEYSVELFSASGLLVKSLKGNSLNLNPIPVGDLSGGMYYCRFRMKNSIELIPFLMVR